MFKKYLALASILFLMAEPGFNQTKLTLAECVDYATNRNLSLKVGMLDLEQSRQNEIQSKLNLLPTLNGVATHGYNWGQRIDPFTNTFATSRVQTNNFGLSTNFDVFNGFANQNQAKAAKYQRLSTEEGFKKNRDNIALEVTNAFLETVSNTELLNVAEIQLEITQEQLLRTQALVAAGVLPRINQLDLEAQYAQEKANLTNAKNNRDLSALRLAQLIMLTPEEFGNFEIIAPDVSTFDIEKLQMSSQMVYEAALGHLPVIREAENQITAANYSLKANKASRYPSLSFQAFIGTGFSGAATEGTGEPVFLGLQPIGIVQGTNQEVVSPIFISDRSTIPFNRQANTNFNQAITFSLNIPIFNKGQVNNQIRRAELDLERANINLEQGKLQLRQEIEQAYLGALAAYNQYKSEESANVSAQEAFEFTQARFNQQTVNALEFNQAKIRLAQSESNLIRAKYQYVFRVKVLDFYQGKDLKL